MHDAMQAIRSVNRRPALMVVTSLTLAIGIAANAVMFGVVDQLLLQPPAHVAKPDQVKRIYYRDVADGKANTGEVTTYTVLPALRANAPAFREIAGFGFPGEWSVGTGRDARNARAQLVSGNYFRLLGVRPALGRMLQDADDRVPQGDKVAVVSYGYWERELGGDSAAIGRVLPLQGNSFTVVGVAPRGFAGLNRQKIDIWVPISSVASALFGSGWHNTTNAWWMQVIGRVADGATDEVAAAQATAAYRGLLREWAQPWRDSTSSVVLSSVIPARTPTGMSREGRVALWLLGVSAIVLLVACANVANLLLARTVERQREIAIRLALGVGRARLARMLLFEAAWLATIGAAAALVISLFASKLVQRVLLPDVTWNQHVIDTRVFAVTLAVLTLCVLLSGLAPVVHGARTGVLEALKMSSRQIAGSRGRLRAGLMIAQTALSVLLLIGAGLFVQSLNKLVARDIGVDQDRVLRVTMPLRRFGFDSAGIADIYRRGAESVSRIPGVASVATAGMTAPMGSATGAAFEVPGVARPELKLGGPYQAVVSAPFFTTIGATILRGRGFTPEEERAGARVIMVNETLANAYWPGGNAVGQCAMYGDDTDDKVCSLVIGVVKNVLQFSILNDDRAIVYAPTTHPGVYDPLPSTILIRARESAVSLREQVRRQLQALAPSMPYVQVQSYGELLAPQFQPWRLGATMFTLFGVVTLIIAAIGLYSVMAYWVSQRTHEIGVRMALGAQRGDVVRLVTRQAVLPVIAGILLGAAGAKFASRWIVELLYETSPTDPFIYAGAAGLLLLATVVASAVPARRSAAVDPTRAMRDA